jgi:hypothetical protein
MFPQTHNLRRLGPNVHPVHQRCKEHGSVQPGTQIVGCGWWDRGRREEWEQRGCTPSRVGEQHYDGSDGL